MVGRPLKTWLGAFAVAATTLFGATLHAQDCPNLELRNDGWVNDTAAGFQGGFVAGEIGASTFYAEPGQYPFSLSSVRLLFGGDAEGQTRDMIIRVWEDSGGLEPGTLLFEGEFDIESSTQAFSEIPLTSADITITEGGVRIGIVFRHAGFPGIARDDDGSNNFPDRNYIFAQGIGWVQSNLLGLTGDWVMRLCVNSRGGNTSNGTSNGTTGGTSNGTTGMTSNGTTGGTSNGTTVIPDVLAVTRILPSEGKEDAATDVTVIGTGFAAGAILRIGSTELTGVSVQSDTAIVASVPAGITPGVYDLTIIQGVDQFVFNQAFTVKAVEDVNMEQECRFRSDCSSGTCIDGVCTEECAADSDCDWPTSGLFCINRACSAGNGECVIDDDCPGGRCNKGSCLGGGGGSNDDGCSTRDVTAPSPWPLGGVALLALGLFLGVRRRL